MAELLIANKEDLVNIADAIREKSGISGPIALDEFSNLIKEISGGVELKTCTVSISVSNKIKNLVYATLENEQPKMKQEYLSTAMTSYTIQCIQGFGFYVQFDTSYLVPIVRTTNASLIHAINTDREMVFQLENQPTAVVSVITDNSSNDQEEK